MKHIVLGRLAAIAILGSGLTACAGGAKVAGVTLWPASQPRATSNAASLGVNGYLWSSALQTLSFMPLASADPYGGVINYDWYVNPQKPDERLKATVYILDTRLRADGLNIAVFKQTLAAGGTWVDAPVSPQTAIDLENAVLTKARELRNANPRG